MFVDEADGVCVINTVFAAFCKAAPLVALTFHPCGMVETIDETIYVFLFNIWLEDVLCFML